MWITPGKEGKNGSLEQAGLKKEGFLLNIFPCAWILLTCSLHWLEGYRKARLGEKTRRALRGLWYWTWSCGSTEAIWTKPSNPDLADRFKEYSGTKFIKVSNELDVLGEKSLSNTTSCFWIIHLNRLWYHHWNALTLQELKKIKLRKHMKNSETYN